MPLCHRVTDYRWIPPDVLIVSATTHPRFSNIRRVIECSLPGTVCDRPPTHWGLSSEERIQVEHIQDLQQLVDLMDAASTAICVCDNCDISECLDFYRVPIESGESPEDWQYTNVGALLYQAKYSGSAAASNSLASALIGHVRSHPGLRTVQSVAAIPSSSSHEWRPDLPPIWAKEISDVLSVALVGLTRTRAVVTQKQIADLSLRTQNQAGSMRAASTVQGRSVLVIDDVYTGGDTMSEACRALRAAGAARVYGLVATKTVKGTTGFWL